MKRLGRQYIVPILITVIGASWLLNAQGVFPRVDWVWSCGLAAAGLLTLAVGGLDKLTAVAGPFLFVAAICSVIRQTGRLRMETELPLLVMALGIFMLLSHALKLPRPPICREDSATPGAA